MGQDNLSATFCERTQPSLVASLTKSLDIRTPPSSEPQRRIVVALEVEVMSTNDDSGNTMNGTTDGENQERQLRAFEPTVKYIDRVLLSLPAGTSPLACHE